MHIDAHQHFWHYAAADYLLSREPGEVHVVLDNAGTELAMDFVLTDALLDGIAERGWMKWPPLGHGVRCASYDRNQS